MPLQASLGRQELSCLSATSASSGLPGLRMRPHPLTRIQPTTASAQEARGSYTSGLPFSSCAFFKASRT